METEKLIQPYRNLLLRTRVVHRVERTVNSLTGIILALFISGFSNPARAQAQTTASSVENQVAIVPQSSAVTITFPTAITVNASQKRNLTTAVFLAKPLLDSNGNVAVESNSPVNVEIQPTKGGAQIKAIALVVNGRIVPIQATGPLIPDHQVISTGNSQNQGFYNSLAGSAFSVLLNTSGVASRLGSETANSIGNSLGSGLVTISGISSTRMVHQVDIPQGGVFILTLDTPLAIPPKGVQPVLATQTPANSAPIATIPPSAQTQAIAALIPTPRGITIIPPAQTQSSASNKESISSTKKVIYVNGATGIDSTGAGNTEATPIKTITYALKEAQAGTVIQLAPGTYSEQIGEVFPLVLKPGIILRGEPSTKGQNTVISGGGKYLSPTFARQNITLRALEDSTITGITITNPNTRGTALWIESTNPTVTNNTFTGSNREGIFVTGKATPQIEANIFTKNGGNGISMASSAQGEIRNNLFQDTGFGIAIGGNASPIVSGNQFLHNQDGMLISDDAHPILRSNTIKSNQQDGLVIAACSQAQPDLGTNSTAGGNIFGDNGQYDIYNSGAKSLVEVGNQLNPKHVAQEKQQQQQCSL